MHWRAVIEGWGSSAMDALRNEPSVHRKPSVNEPSYGVRSRANKELSRRPIHYTSVRPNLDKSCVPRAIGRSNAREVLLSVFSPCMNGHALNDQMSENESSYAAISRLRDFVNGEPTATTARKQLMSRKSPEPDRG